MVAIWYPSDLGSRTIAPFQQQGQSQDKKTEVASPLQQYLQQQQQPKSAISQQPQQPQQQQQQQPQQQQPKSIVSQQQPQQQQQLQQTPNKAAKDSIPQQTPQQQQQQTKSIISQQPQQQQQAKNVVPVQHNDFLHPHLEQPQTLIHRNIIPFPPAPAPMMMSHLQQQQLRAAINRKSFIPEVIDEGMSIMLFRLLCVAYL